MKIDLHIHTRTGSDGKLSLDEVFEEAAKRRVEFLSITDHDSVVCQERAVLLAKEKGLRYITGVELNVTFRYPGSKDVSLDFLGYRFDPANESLQQNLQRLKDHREQRALQILENVNREFEREGIPKLTEQDLQQVQENVDGVFGRPHIADYLVAKGIVRDRQEAFDRYLVTCDVPKYPLSLKEASTLIRKAGGLLVLAHPNDPNGTSLVKATENLGEQSRIIEEHMLSDIDGTECWHSRHDEKTATHYREFCQEHSLIATGGSDCHQKPIIMGTVDVPDWVASQFDG